MGAGAAYVCDLADPVQLLLDLIAKVDEINLNNGIPTSIDVKRAAAVRALTDVVDSNNVAAIGALNAFINAVRAQSRTLISVEDADCLIADALAILDLIC